ncbi:U3 small nucleolar RNA-associated protein 13 [Kockovaella imperatae]|uniref:U3 small nucleolar RNA-associated protein 13 n=1 Tax=Kockovaella imperatae TaxID=4999 RepID=A0A1Y1U816_9TREE|nr:U3 small nucleolar RNA-associated protein 13 [Kockovaella imperatae]ORX34153.1 U3 small nucleolar RNA-associated protein 13 [Kockovaella imperatae]
MSNHKRALKTSYRASPRSIRPLYTGGPVILTRDGSWLVTTMDEEVLITDVESGAAVGRVRGDGSAITSLALSYHTSPPTLVTCHMSTTIRFYPLPDAGSQSTASSSTSAPLLSYSRQLNKAHTAPILVSTVSPDSTLLATGSSDGVVKVWDTAGGYVTHMYRGHGGPVSAVKFWFNDDRSRMELWTGSTDGKIRVFDLLDASSRSRTGDGSAKAKSVLTGHESVVRGVDVSTDGRWAVSGGRDKVILVWDLEDGGLLSKKGKRKGTSGPRIVQTILAHEQVEAVGLLSPDQPLQGSTKTRLRCFAGGDQGLVRVWDVISGEEVAKMKAMEGVDESSEDEDEQRGVINVLYDESSSSLISIHADQNIVFHSLISGSRRQIIGFNDEIIDATFLSTDSETTSPSHLALATNSSLIRLYTTDKLDARLLSGHSDMVLCLDKTSDHRWLASGSKDMTARIWGPSFADDSDETRWECLGVCEGHAESVGAVAFSKQRNDRAVKFIVTASQDRTVKLWDLSVLDPDSTSNSSTPKLRSLVTLRAHEKDINSLDVSPNDRFLVSGSQDKLVKIFEIDYSTSSSGAKGGLKLVGTCKGHRRGVWTVKFSRTDKVIASGAADRTVKLWSLDDFTCLKTFEGHTNSVLRVDFLTHGMQLVTSSSDGLVKLWNIKDEACVRTLDNHEDKVWALAVSADEKTIVSAGADSLATFWEDSTEVEQAERNDAVMKAFQSEQDFTNYVALKDYRRAIQLALAMSQPGRLLNLFTSVLAASLASNEGESGGAAYSGSRDIDEVIRTLSGLDLTRLLKHVRDWNANAKTSAVAQAVLNAILKLKSPEDILAAFDSTTRIPNLDPADTIEGADDEYQGRQRKKAKIDTVGLRELLDGLIPYSERHFARLGRLIQDSYVLDYVVGEMDGGMFGGEVMEIDGGLEK